MFAMTERKLPQTDLLPVKSTHLSTVATYVEMWVLSFLFVTVVAVLLQLQNVQIHDQAQSLRTDEVPYSLSQPQISRNHTPALGY
jgi:hypothetical protein